MKKGLTIILFAVLCLFAVSNIEVIKRAQHEEETIKARKRWEIKGAIKKGETFSDIFRDYKLDTSELYEIKRVSARIHKLKEVRPGQIYRIVVDENKNIQTLVYFIDEDKLLNVTKGEEGYEAKEEEIQYERKILHVYGKIEDNLITSMKDIKDGVGLAIDLSDIYQWDIDFNTDIRVGDTYKVVIEGLYLDGEFKRYGDIIAAEFINDGKRYNVYRFEYDGRSGYYDEDGRSVKRAFLKAPLSYRRISSVFTKDRYHPILKIRRPHYGIDYAAPIGTPIVSIGRGRVVFAGFKGQYGKLIIIRHKNGFKTYYGHLSRIMKGIKKGVQVEQGDLIGYVGATGLATGPHLHFEVRLNNRPINPNAIKPPSDTHIPPRFMAAFKAQKVVMNARLTSISTSSLCLLKGASRMEKG